MNISLLINVFLAILLGILFLYTRSLYQTIKQEKSDFQTHIEKTATTIRELEKKIATTTSLSEECSSHIKEFQAHNKMTDILLTKIKADLGQVNKTNSPPQI